MSHIIPSRLLTDERGQAVVEFALVIVFLVILAVSILEMSLFLYTYTALSGAAKEGVRYAVVHGSSGSSLQPDCGTAMSSGASTTVLTYASVSLHKLNSGNVSISCPNGNSPGNLVTVGVTYPFQPLFLTNWASVTISTTSVGRIQF